MIISHNKLVNQKSIGFTIVELLVVIVLIGILAAITIVSYQGITARANETVLTSDLVSAKKQLSLYFAEYGTYPSTDGLSAGTNWCPTLPKPDNKYCLKPTENAIATYSSDTATYNLNYTKGKIAFEVTNDKPPYSPWITIGSQRWAKANLNVGIRIDGANAQANNSTIEKYCYNDDEASCTAYGGLYQWNEAMNYSTTEGAQGICPVGSHIPTDNDWKILEVQLGMTQAQADATGWRGVNQGSELKPNGSSGLNIPIAGHRRIEGLFANLSTYARLWSSSESSSSVWSRDLGESRAEVYRVKYDKVYGYSVRCVGD